MPNYAVLHQAAHHNAAKSAPKPYTLNDVDLYLVDSSDSMGHAITRDGKYLDKPDEAPDPHIANDPSLSQEEYPALTAIEPGYVECFPIDEERTERGDLGDNLDRNNDADFQAKLPKGCRGSKEAWVYARDKRTGEMVGSLNFNAQAGSEVLDKKGQTLVDGYSVVIYSCVPKKFRQRGVFSLLQEAHDKVSTAFVEEKLGLAKGTGRVFGWCEQTDSGLISAEDHARDAIHSCTRSDIFEKRGYRSIRGTDGKQVIYNQPDTDVANGENPARIVNMRVRPINCKLPEEFPRGLAREAVEDFIAASFQEGTDPRADVHKNMWLSLNSPVPIKLMPPGSYKDLGKVLSNHAINLIAQDPSYKDMPLSMVAYKALQKPVTDDPRGVEGKNFRKTLASMKGAYETFYALPEAGVKAYTAEALSDKQWAPEMHRQNDATRRSRFKVGGGRF